LKDISERKPDMLPIEYASAHGSDETASFAGHAINAYRSLAAATGLDVQTVAELMLGGESRCLFAADGKLRPAEELRSLNTAGRLGAPISGKDAQEHLQAMRFGPGPISGKDAREHLQRMRFGPGPISGLRAQRELVRLRRKGYPR
jgi:hypothetical protein